MLHDFFSEFGSMKFNVFELEDLVHKILRHSLKVMLRTLIQS